MTGEIEFRAWNIYKEEMIELGDLESIFITDRNLDFANYEIMQFTGLRDKNGVKIYEGDICKVYTGKICQVLFEAPIFCLKILNDKSDFRYQTDTTFRDSDVLGNIYENPELLEGK